MDTEVRAALALDLLRLFSIGAINLRIMFHLARFDQTGVEFLVPRQFARPASQRLAALGECHYFDPLDSAAAPITAGIDCIDTDESLLAQKGQVPLHAGVPVAIDRLGEIAGRNYPEASDFGEDLAFFLSQRETYGLRRDRLPAGTLVHRTVRRSRTSFRFRLT